MRFNLNRKAVLSATLLSAVILGGIQSSVVSAATQSELTRYFELEGASPFKANNVQEFSSLESQHVTKSGHGWRNELKIKDSLRKKTSQTYQTFSADVNVKLSKGAKTIIAQYHEADTGTLLKVYVSDTSEKGTARDGVFEVYVRILGSKGKEKRYDLGTIRSGQSFNLSIELQNDRKVYVTALGTSVAKKMKESNDIFFKFGDYLQAQDPETGEQYEKGDFAKFYKDQGITLDKITYSNVRHYLN